MIKDIEANVVVSVEPVTAPTRELFNKRTIEGKYDIIWKCNACYLKIHEKAGYIVIARGNPSFHGVVIVREDSDSNKLEDLKGKKIAAVGSHSIAVYLFLKNKLLDLGLEATKDFSVEFFGKSESIPFLVYNKRFDVGEFSEDVFKRQSMQKNVPDLLTLGSLFMQLSES